MTQIKIIHNYTIIIIIIMKYLYTGIVINTCPVNHNYVYTIQRISAAIVDT
jgi:hypothetical protein